MKVGNLLFWLTVDKKFNRGFKARVLNFVLGVSGIKP